MARRRPHAGRPQRRGGGKCISARHLYMARRRCAEFENPVAPGFQLPRIPNHWTLSAPHRCHRRRSFGSQISFTSRRVRDIRSVSTPTERPFKSTDAGKTWHAIGLAKPVRLARLSSIPLILNTVYVAALATSTKANPERGVYCLRMVVQLIGKRFRERERPRQRRCHRSTSI